MYFRILKKDLKRNRAMNIILLVFVLISAMFVSSSANNIITVMTARDRFFEMSNMSDYFVMTKGMAADELNEIVGKTESAESFHTEPLVFLSKDDVLINGKAIEQAPTLSLYSLEQASLTYFTMDDEPIGSMESGTILLPNKLGENNDISVGDTMKITLGSTQKEFTVAGFIKDALLGSPNIGNTRCVIADEDFDEFYSEATVKEQQRQGALCSVKTDDVKKFANELMESNLNTTMMADLNMVSSMYILDLAVAGVLLIVSFCLVLIAVVVLRFTINFTLSQEFREIGVMKAVGISNRRIKALYLVKYFAVSLVGAALGLAAGIPFGNMMLDNTSQTLIIEGSGFYFINVICVALVVFIVMIFCWGGTKKVNVLSPVAAVRDGSQGERFSKKSPLSLSKGRMRPIPFLALNDILSSVKRYITMITAFTLCLIMTIVVVNTINTLKGEGLVSYFGTAESDVYLVCSSEVDYFMEGGRDNFKRDLKEMEKTLDEECMSGHAFGEVLMFSTLNAGENSYAGMLFQGTGVNADQYVYSEGTAPQKADEIAITSTVADALGVTIGDTVTYSDMGEKREVIVTALFQSMMNMGNGVRLHQDAEVNYAQVAGFNAYQITFDDNPDTEELERRMERLAEIYPDYRIMTGGEYADYFTGSADMVTSIRNFLVPLMMLVCMLIAMLMERSFIAKEQGQIAMLKAAGFTNGAVVRWHTLRMGIVLLISTVIGVALSTPATQLLITPIFRMMGADSIKYEINPIEAYAIYPVILGIATLAAVALAAQGTRRITASQTSSIE